MIVLGLDLSTHCGWAVIQDCGLSDSTILDYGCIECDNVEKVLYLPEDFFFLDRASHIAFEVMELIGKFNPDFVYVEQTNLGRARDSQKQLEFIHCRILEHLLYRSCGDFSKKTRYIDTSNWRKILDIRLGKDDKKNNKLVREGKKRGKITSKHLSVRWANLKYALDLKIKDNDIADALAVAACGLSIEKGNATHHAATMHLADEINSALMGKG
jgi:Holliday junction resolvasome RuvABC endonuclease subunit